MGGSNGIWCGVQCLTRYYIYGIQSLNSVEHQIPLEPTRTFYANEAGISRERNWESERDLCVNHPGHGSDVSISLSASHFEGLQTLNKKKTKKVLIFQRPLIPL